MRSLLCTLKPLEPAELPAFVKLFSRPMTSEFGFGMQAELKSFYHPNNVPIGSYDARSAA